MTVDRSHDAANDAERERLGKLVARLSDEELSRPMPAGWTAAAMLAHAGFWDARAVFALQKWATTGAPPPPGDYEPDDVDWINESAKPFLLALPPRAHDRQSSAKHLPCRKTCPFRPRWITSTSWKRRASTFFARPSRG